MARTVLGLFTDIKDAEDAIGELRDDDYDPKEISIVMKDTEKGEEIAGDTGASVAGNTASGIAAGAALGGLAGLVASFAIPGLGAFFIGGPIAASLGLSGAAAATVSGATTGALAGGLVGMLTGLGLSEHDARNYEERVNDGAILIAVPARPGEANRVEQILNDFNADDIHTISNTDTRESYEKNEGRRSAFAGMKGGKTKNRISKRRDRNR